MTPLTYINSTTLKPLVQRYLACPTLVLTQLNLLATSVESLVEFMSRGADELRSGTGCGANELRGIWAAGSTGCSVYELWGGRVAG